MPMSTSYGRPDHCDLGTDSSGISGIRASRLCVEIQLRRKRHGRGKISWDNFYVFTLHCFSEQNEKTVTYALL